MIFGAAAPANIVGPSPELRVEGPAVSSDANPVPSTHSLTIPSSAQVGDYIIIGSVGVPFFDDSYTRGSKWGYWYSQYAQGTYWNSCCIFIKHCEAEDIGDTVVLKTYGTNYAIACMVDVIKNPNQTQVKPHNNADFYRAHSGRLRTTQFLSDGDVTSLAVTTVGPDLECPVFGYCRYTVCGAYGNTAMPTMSYTGGGYFRTQNDSYWFQSVGRVIEPDVDNANDNVGTFSKTPTGSMSALSIVIM